MALNPRSAAPVPGRKLAFAALHHRDYRRYFIVNLFSTMGDNIERKKNSGWGWLLLTQTARPTGVSNCLPSPKAK